MKPTLLPFTLAAMLFGSTVTAQDPQLTVLHGVPGLPKPVDVFVNGKKAFSFDYPDKVGPITLPAGTYKVEVKLDNTVILSGNPTLAKGMVYDAVAHLKADGKPNLAFFANDTSKLRDDDARVIVRHLAKAPAVDVVFEGDENKSFRNVSNGQAGSADIDADDGDYKVSIFAAGTTNRVFGPVELELREDVVYRFHAIGDIAGKFTVAISSYDLTTMTPLLSVARMGQACGGEISSSNPAPRVGESFSIRLGNATRKAPALLHIGDSNSMLGNVMLPLPLAAFGAPGCSLYQNAMYVLAVQTDGHGNAAVKGRLPVEIAAGFQPLFVQYSFAAPKANALGVLATGYLTIQLQ